MISIQYPPPSFKIEHRGDRPYIFDPIRRKWLLLQDEEWVRQNFVQYLLQVMQYPQSMIALEKKIYLGELKKRFDILVYDPFHQPWMLIECKSQKVPITENVLHQVLRYNMSIPAPYLVLTNGGDHYGWQKIENRLLPITALPKFIAHQ